ncbi:MAG TPA: fumarylacetoacetate hydrolase family protein [Steroidobacteraceae bacterium]|jgi:2-keto-4-pentenoate hydratase|nr:fumarylacetoacetate hydrolase family protein [Steroidobacteraceae bacterium]
MSDRLQRAAQYLAALRQAGPRPVSLPQELAPQNAAQAYELQQRVARELKVSAGGWKVAMSGLNAGSYAPVFATDLHASGARVTSAISQQLGVEPEVAFTLKRTLPAGRRYTREQVIEAIGSAHAAIEIVISRFQRHETAAVLDRLADNISNGGLVLGPALDRWQHLDFSALPLTLTLTAANGEARVHQSRGGHPQADPLLPMTWIVNERAALGFGMRQGEVVTTGSFAGLHYAARGTRVRVEFEGLGGAELYG